MIKTFVELLRKRIAEERSRAVERASTQTGVTLEQHAATVARNLALLDVETWVSELYKIEADELDDEPEETPPPARQAAKPPRRHAPLSRSWGTD